MDLQLTLIIMGSLAILGLLIHGLWVSRKNNTPEEHWSKDNIDYDAPNIGLGDTPQKVSAANDQEGAQFNDSVLNENIDLPNPMDELDVFDNAPQFDEYGVGKAKIKDSPQASNSDETSVNSLPVVDSSEPQLDDIPTFDINTPVPSMTTNPIAESETPAAPMYASVVTNPKPNHVIAKTDEVDSASDAVNPIDSSIPVPPPHFMQNAMVDPDNNTGEDESTSEISIEQDVPIYSVPQVDTPSHQADVEPVVEPPVVKKPSLTEQAKNLVIRKQRRSAPVRGKINEDQMRIDFDTVDPVLNADKAAASAVSAETDSASQQSESAAMPPEFLSLNVRVSKDNPIMGPSLLASLLTLGFKFGESDIFHRHVNSNGKGPVLFSLASMFKPGVFDVNNMEAQQYYGLTLFMSLPIEGDAHQVFNMMHNAARKLADEFAAQVLDEQRSALTQQGLQHYVERIRAFEKRRLFGQ